MSLHARRPLPRRCPSLTRHCSIATIDDEDNLALNMTRLSALVGGSRFREGVRAIDRDANGPAVQQSA